MARSVGDKNNRTQMIFYCFQTIVISWSNYFKTKNQLTCRGGQGTTYFIYCSSNSRIHWSAIGCWLAAHKIYPFFSVFLHSTTVNTLFSAKIVKFGIYQKHGFSHANHAIFNIFEKLFDSWVQCSNLVGVYCMYLYLPHLWGWAMLGFWMLN